MRNKAIQPKPWPEVQAFLGPLSRDRREALAKSIADFGYQGPPVYCLPDGRIIDGHHRWEIAGETCEVKVLSVDEETGKALAFAHNMARRQLTQQRIKEIRAAQRKIAMQLRSEGKTQAEAALAVGVHRSAVDAWESENTTNASSSIASNSTPATPSENSEPPPQTEPPAPPPDVRVKLSKSNKEEIVSRLDCGASQAQVAADFGVTQQTVSRVYAAALKTRREVAEREAAAANVEIPSGVIVGDFRDHCDRIPDASVDLIFTDPPYDRPSVGLYGDLAKLAAAKLRPGGSLLAYCGQYLLPEILDLMRPHLRYWWTLAVIHTGPVSRMREYGIQVGWKPVVWFVQQTRADKNTWVRDAIVGKGKEKATHRWQQGLSEAITVMKALCPPKGFVCEPFLGGGTTIVAAKQLKLRWVAFEIDPKAAKQASLRLEK